jgi:ankyrin repeat protein
MLAWSIPTFCGEIHEAARDGDWQKVKALLNDNPELIFSVDGGGQTPLHPSAFRGQKNVVKLPRQHGGHE